MIADKSPTGRRLIGDQSPTKMSFRTIEDQLQTSRRPIADLFQHHLFLNTTYSILYVWLNASKDSGDQSPTGGGNGQNPTGTKPH